MKVGDMEIDMRSASLSFREFSEAMRRAQARIPYGLPKNLDATKNKKIAVALFGKAWYPLRKK